MNAYFIAAGGFLFVVTLIHTIFGNIEYAALNPRKLGIFDSKPFQNWLMGRGCFQMVTADLLLSGIFIFLTGINAIPYSFYLMLFMALLYLGYLVFWLASLFVSKAEAVHYIKVGQWSLFLVVFILTVSGMFEAVK